MRLLRLVPGQRLRRLLLQLLERLERLLLVVMLLQLRRLRVLRLALDAAAAATTADAKKPCMRVLRRRHPLLVVRIRVCLPACGRRNYLGETLKGALRPIQYSSARRQRTYALLHTRTCRAAAGEGP